MGVPQSRVNMMARALLDAGILPKSSGRDIKRINGEELAALVAAVAFAERGEDAAMVAQAFTEMMLDGRIPDMRFGWYFGMLMTSEIEVFPTIELGKTQDGFTATAIPGGGDDAHVMGFWQADLWGGWVKRTVTIHKSGIEIMRNLFIRDDADGMVFKRG